MVENSCGSLTQIILLTVLWNACFTTDKGKKYCANTLFVYLTKELKETFLNLLNCKLQVKYQETETN